MFLSAFANSERSGSEESYLSRLGEDVDISKAAALKEDKKNEIDQQINFHLTQYIANFSSNQCALPTYKRVETLFARRKWVKLTQLCRLIGDSPFIFLNDSEIINLFLGNGLCVGGVIQHFNRFFHERSCGNSSLFPLECPPFPIQDPLFSEEGIRFYPFEVNADSLKMQTQHLRFLQTAYKASFTFKKVGPLEFIPSSILKNHDLKVEKRIPDLSVSREKVLKITDLLPKLKELAEQNTHENGYLLAIKGESMGHAIALHLKMPFHFMDLPHGVAVADSLEQLTLFLAVYLTEKYTTFYSFYLLEFLSTSK